MPFTTGSSCAEQARPAGAERRNQTRLRLFAPNGQPLLGACGAGIADAGNASVGTVTTDISAAVIPTGAGGALPIFAQGTGTPGIFGRGEGRWGTNDANVISVQVIDPSAGCGTFESAYDVTDLSPRIEVVSIDVVGGGAGAGDLAIVIKNRGGTMPNGNNANPLLATAGFVDLVITYNGLDR